MKPSLIMKVAPCPVVLALFGDFGTPRWVSLMSNSSFGDLGQGTMALLMCLVLASGLCMFYLVLRWEIEPVYVISIGILIPLILFAMRKCPLVILTGLLFVG